MLRRFSFQKTLLQDSLNLLFPLWVKSTTNMIIGAPEIILIFVCGFIQLPLIRALKWIAPKIKLIDTPGGRKNHTVETPLIGGLTIYFVLLLAVSINGGWHTTFGWLVICTALVVLIGLIDDIKSIAWYWRMAFQLSATICAIVTTDLRITFLGVYPLIGSLDLGIMSYIITALAVVGVTNAFNLIDGINGLCGSVALIPLIAMSLAVYYQIGSADFHLVLLIVLLSGFLYFNTWVDDENKIFLGDAGSAAIGFIISFLMIALANDNRLSVEPTLLPWLVLVPVSDTGSVILRRVAEKRPVFAAASDHFHHILGECGFPKHTILFILVLIGVFGATAGFLLTPFSDLISLSMFTAVALLMPWFIKKSAKIPALLDSNKEIKVKRNS